MSVPTRDELVAAEMARRERVQRARLFRDLERAQRERLGDAAVDAALVTQAAEDVLAQAVASLT